MLSDFYDLIESRGSDISPWSLCRSGLVPESGYLHTLCDDAAPILLMQSGAAYSLVGAFILLGSFSFFAAIAGKSRERTIKIFSPLVSGTLIAVAVLVLLQGAVLTYTMYLAVNQIVEAALIVFVLTIGLPALGGGLSMIISALSIANIPPHSVIGKKLEPSKHPRLFALIDEVSRKLGSAKPDHVVVGLEPNFYVLSHAVQLIGAKSTLKGRTLFISLPLARILRFEEMQAIIGHELGHFRGKDTEYSLKFMPVYSQLSDAVDEITLEGNEDARTLGSLLVSLPALGVISYMLEVFHTNVSAIDRVRELEADKAASEVADPKFLASSLLKLGLYQGSWLELEERVMRRMSEKGKLARNLSLAFSSIVKYDVNEETVSELLDTIDQHTVAHPIDSHPPTSVRIEQMGLSVNGIEHEMLVIPEHTCMELFEHPTAIEEELTNLQQQHYMATGIELRETEKADMFATALTALGAYMVIADGKIEPEEIDRAELLGTRLVKDFDTIEFREFCLDPETLPKLNELLDASSGLLSQEKQTMYDYLKDIADSDGNISNKEQQLLKRVSEILGVSG